MSDKKVILPSEEALIEKWLPVIESSGKWERKLEGAPKVAASQYGILATQFEILEQVELKEATTTSAISNYTPVLIPMVRRIAPAIIGNEIFGTQPMNGPSGLIFAIKSLYTGSTNNQAVPGNGVILTLADTTGYTVGGFISSTADAGLGVIAYIEDNNVLVNMTSGAFVTGVAVDDAEAFATGTTTVSAVYSAENLAPMIFKNYSGTYSTAAGEALSTDMMELGFEIVSSSVNAKTRKLKSKWTNELEEDLRAVHGLGAEQLLSNICSAEIVKEMNREFINKVKDYSALTCDNGLATATWTYDATENFTQGRYENEKYLSLYNEIDRQRQNVALSSMRGQATFAVVTPKVKTALQAIGKLPKGGEVLSNTYVGDVDGLKIYVDAFGGEASDAIYFGYKGASEVDAGMFYCPYVPLKINKGVGEEDNIPRLFFSTRYGLSENPFGAKNFYHKLNVASMP